MEHICTVAELEKKCVNLHSFHPALFSSQRKSPVKYYSEKSHFQIREMTVLSEWHLHAPNPGKS